jgi:hypothetical protein
MENSLKYCDNARAEGCLNRLTNIIYLNLRTKNINYNFYHELGHAQYQIKWQSIMASYPPTPNSKLYLTEVQQSDEKFADYYANYKLNPNLFSLEYPSIYIWFRDNVK